MRNRTVAALAAGSIAIGTIAGLTIAGSSAAAGAVRHYRVIERSFSVGSGQTRAFTVKCPSGYSPVGGGGHAGSGEWAAYSPAYAGISGSDISLNHKGWTVTAFVTSSQGATYFTADAVCANW
jgi:hypothetical protein